MDVDVLLYIGTLSVMVIIFGAIVVRAYSKRRHEEVEAPKRRMLED